MEPGRVQDSSARDRASAEIEAAVTGLFVAGRGWTKKLAERFNPELAPVTFGVLRHISVHGPLRSGDIAEVFGMDKGAMSRQIAGLRELGLVTSTPDPDDRRASLLVTTATAEAAFTSFGAEIRRQYDHIMDDWSTGDLVELARLLSRFSESIS